MPGEKNYKNEELGRKRQEKKKRKKTNPKEVIRTERSESELRSCVRVEVAVLGFPS